MPQNARVSAFTRWNNLVVDSRKTSIDYLALDHFRQEVFSQEEFYESCVRPFVNRCLQGCSGSIITHGAWGSGKSYTLGALDPQQLAQDSPSGSETAGVLSRCTQQLYNWLGQGAGVEITCVEVQGDDVLDLLDQRAAHGPVSRPASATDASPAGGIGAVGRNGTAYSSTSSCCGALLAAGGCSPGADSAAVQAGFSRSPIAVAAAGAASASRRKPLTPVVARSLSEALVTLQRAVSNRQAFVTATRHSSSRTHAVFQLRWRNPAVPATGGTAGATAPKAGAPPPPGYVGSGAGRAVTHRAYSAPPRASLPFGPAGCAAAASAADGRPAPGSGAGGPICTLTLVDTCSFCPLLPPKEGSAVKRSLLALSRVLTGLQRRHALTLRESKLTRMLEGAVDQVLLLACLGGASDDPTIQLVKMLQQGMIRESSLRRSRRASSANSTHASVAWEPAVHASIFSVAAAARRAQLAQPSGGAAASFGALSSGVSKCSLIGGGKAAATASPGATPVGGQEQGHGGPARSYFRLPGSPPLPVYGRMSDGRSMAGASAQTEPSPLRSGRDGAEAALAGVDSATAVRGSHGGVLAAGSGGGSTSSGGGAGTEADATAGPMLSTSSLGAFSSSRAASSHGADDGSCSGGGASADNTFSAALPTASSPPRSARRPPPLIINARPSVANSLAPSDGGAVICAMSEGCSGAGASVSGGGAVAQHERRAQFSTGGGGGVITTPRRAGSLNPGAPEAILSRRMSPRLVLGSPRQKPPSVSARAPPLPEVRRSQGFSILAGKWSPPPPMSTRDTNLPVVSSALTPRHGVLGSATASSSLRPSPGGQTAATSTAGSTPPNGLSTVSERPPRGASSAAPSPRAASAPVPSGPGPCPAGAAAEVKRGATGASSGAAMSALYRGASGGGASSSGKGFVSPFAAAAQHPLTASTVPPSALANRPDPHHRVTSTLSVAAAARIGTAAGGGSPASAGSLSARRKPSAPGLPPAKLPLNAAAAAQSTFASAASSPPPPPRPSIRRTAAAARSPSPVLSLSASRPSTRLISKRYGGANVSEDSLPDVAATAAGATISAALSDEAAVAPPPPPASLSRRRSLLRQYPAEEEVTVGGAASRSTGGAAAAAGDVPARQRSGEVTAVAALRRSVSSGLRWPSPLLRARRTEWLSDLRRSRSAFHRPTSGAAADPQEEEGEGGARVRRLSHGFRCSAKGRPTLSSLYKDLLVDFEAFKAMERQPRHGRSCLGAAEPSVAPKAAPSPSRLPTSAAGGPAGSPRPSPGYLCASGDAASNVARGLAASAPKPGSPRRPRSGSDVCTSIAPAVSPAVSTGSTPRSARPVSGSFARQPSAFSLAQPPAADEGMMSLTAAAAVAAASPRTPASGGGLPSVRPRPGVSRTAGTMASPRPPRSPERPSTPVSPATVLDMSRLFPAKGSPSTAGTAAATQPPQPGSGRSRLSAATPVAASTSVSMSTAGAPPASGGSDRYRRLTELNGADSSDLEDSDNGKANLDPDSDHGPCGSSDSERDNLLGPGCLDHLGLMLDTCGDVAALRNSISKLAGSSRASPAVAGRTTGVASVTTSPSPLRRARPAAAAAAAPAASSVGAWSTAQSQNAGVPDEELPAVSFFIHQFTPRSKNPEAGGALEQRPADAEEKAAVAEPAVAAGGVADGGTSVSAVPAAGAVAGEEEAPCAVTAAATVEALCDAAGAEACRAQEGLEAVCLEPLASMDVVLEAVAAVSATDETAREPEPEPESGVKTTEAEQRQEQQQPAGHTAESKLPGVSAALLAAAKVAAAAAAADVRLPYLPPHERSSVESGVLRGSCTSFAALSDGVGGSIATAASSGGGGPLPLPSSPPLGPMAAAAQAGNGARENGDYENGLSSQCDGSRQLRERAGSDPTPIAPVAGGVTAAVAASSGGKAVPEPPSQSSVQLRQLLKEQEQLLMMPREQWLGRRGPNVAAATTASLAGGAATSAAAGSGPITLLGHPAHVRPIHFDLDEHSNVRVDEDSGSETEATPQGAATRRTIAGSAQRSGGPRASPASAIAAAVAATAAAAANPLRLSPPLPEPPTAIRTPSPVKPIASASPLKLLQRHMSGSRRGQQTTSLQTRLATLEAAAAAISRTSARLMQSWAHEGSATGRHSSPASATAAATAAARQGGTADGTRRGMTQIRSTPVAAEAVVGRQLFGGGGPGPLCWPVPVAVRHLGQLSADAVPGAGGADTAAGSRGPLGRSAASAAAVGVVASPPSSPPLQKVARSGELGGEAVRRSLNVLPLPPSSHQQSLRGSGNVAAAWRAAAAMTISSNASVRSCFRSSSGQHPPPQQQSMLGSDTAAVATVVALSRVDAACRPVDKDHGTSATDADAAAVGAAPAVAKAAIGATEHLQSAAGPASAATAAAASAATYAAAAAASIAPRLPPDPTVVVPPPPRISAVRSAVVDPTLPPPQPRPVPPASARALPQAAPPPPPPPRGGPAASLTALVTKAKSVRGDKSLPLATRLRAYALYRGPRAAASPATGSGSVGNAGAGVLVGAVEPPQPPPPPAYPPGFVTWATKLFSSSSKKKRQPS